MWLGLLAARALRLTIRPPASIMALCWPVKKANNLMRKLLPLAEAACVLCVCLLALLLAGQWLKRLAPRGGGKCQHHDSLCR